MAEKVLISYINAEIPLEDLVNWLNSPPNAVKDENLDNKFSRCDAQDFLLYVLNFIHDDVFVNNDNNNKNSQKKTNIDNPPAEGFGFSNRDFPNLHTSTPKLGKNRSDLNFTWPRKGSEHIKAQKKLNFQRDRSLCLGDFVTNRKVVPSKQKKRRIKPTTLVEDKSSESNEKSSESVELNNKENFFGVPCKNVEESRNFILEDLVEMQRNNLNLDTTCPIFNNKVGKSEVIPSFEKCTKTVEITLVVNLYLYFVKNNFFLSILSEIYSLISLLTYKQFRDDTSKLEISKISNRNDLNILFRSLHNQTYFSLEILSNLTDYFKIFDKTTLTLLLSNQRLRNFAKDRYINLENRIKQLIIEKQSVKNDDVTNINSLDVRNVNFTSESDNRDNFVFDGSFHAFRKQRDAFYDILKTWEDKHTNPEWNFSAAFSNRIKSLLSLYDNPVNFRQFAKLFKSQLLLVAHRECEDEVYMQNEEAILQHFPSIDSSKLNKLKLRLSSKPEPVGLDSKPSFPGYQEFFRDFISTCSSHSFLEHLKDVFLAEILSDDEYKFTGYDLDRRGENVLKIQAVRTVKEKLTKLLVLAKFLGYLESLPFQCDFKKMSKKVVQNQIGTRRHYRGIVDVRRLLTESIGRSRLTFTVPWIVVYLSMLDYITLRLPCFEEAIRILFSLYWGCQNFDSADGLYTKLLTITSLNWLFGLPHFPNEIYYKFLFEKRFDDSTLIDRESFRNVSEEYFVDILNGKIRNDFPIDKLDLITDKALYICCPGLETFKNVLSSTTSQQRSITRHITPLTKTETQKTKEEIQKQLEGAFLNSQPHSVRKIIEFSSENITSGCIRHLFMRLSQIRKSIVADYVNKIKTSLPGNETDSERLEREYGKEISEETPKVVQRIKSSCSEIAEGIISERTELAVKGLMPVDNLAATIRKCSDVSAKICREKIRTWTDSTVTADWVEKSLLQEGRRIFNRPQHKITSNLPSGGKDMMHSDETLSAVKIADKLKLLMIDIIENKNIAESDVEPTLNNCKNTIESRCDVNDNITSAIHKLTVELFIALVCFNPDLAENSLETFRRYWTHFKTTVPDIFKQTVSFRNVHMLSQSADRRKSWDVFAKLLSTINADGLLASEDLEQQCLGVFKQDWDKGTLTDICNCYRRLIENLKDGNVTFGQLLSFLSDYCLNLNDF